MSVCAIHAGLNFFLFLKFFTCQRIIQPNDLVCCKTRRFSWIHYYTQNNALSTHCRCIKPFPNKLFPQPFLHLQRIFHHFHVIHTCHLQTLSVWKSLNFIIWERVKPLFAREQLHLNAPRRALLLQVSSSVSAGLY